MSTTQWEAALKRKPKTADTNLGGACLDWHFTCSGRCHRHQDYPQPARHGGHHRCARGRKPARQPWPQGVACSDVGRRGDHGRLREHG